MKRVLIVVGLSLIVGRNLAQAQTVDDRLIDMQIQLDKQQQTIIQMQHKINVLEEKNEVSTPVDESLEGIKQDLEVAHEQNLSLFEELRNRAKINLYGTLEFSNFEKTKSTFQGRDFEILADIKASKRFRIFAGLQAIDQCIHCHRPGTPGTRESLESTLNRGSRDRNLVVTQGWIEYSINRYINPRFGIILVPFGRYNQEHYDTTQELVSRPIMALDVVPTVWSEAGAGFTGSISLADASSSEWLQEFELNYQLYVVNGLTDAHIEDTGLGMTPGRFNNDNNNNKALVGRLELNPLTNISIVLIGYLGAYDTHDNNILAYDIDWKIEYGPAEVVGEFANFDLDEGVNDAGLAVPENLHGGYIEGRYHFWPNFLNKTFLGWELDDPKFTAIIRAGYVETKDDGDPDEGDNREERLTMGFNYRPIESLVVKLEYQINKTENEPFQMGDNNGFMASVSAAF
jgi:hypothetical protein